MQQPSPLPLAPALRSRWGADPIPTLHELAEPDAGPSRSHAVADRLRDLAPSSAPTGGLLHALARWLVALSAAGERLLDAAELDRRLDDDLGAGERARLTGAFASLIGAPVVAATTSDDSSTTGTAPPTPPHALLAALLLTLDNDAAASPLSWLGLGERRDDPDLGRLAAAYRAALSSVPVDGERRNALDVLEAPRVQSPARLDEQLLAAADVWRPWLGDDADHCARAAGVVREENRPYFEGPGETPVYEASDGAFGHDHEDVSDDTGSHDDPEAEHERFSADRDWMPRLVLLAKHTFVWLDQLSRRYGKEIHTLDRIPDAELDAMAARGITGLWLIGLWERSAASRAIKQECGNPEALASAYAVSDYRIADVLGGDDALDDLRVRALERGIRLCGDMVPNHTGIDARWVLERPDLYLGLDHCPYPGYTFDGPELSPDPEVSLRLEDHYWDRTDAAVVFRRTDRRTGDTRYLYHGNDGTSMPWNDTAQLDFTNPATREAVMDVILEVARRFPIIRFDAAMVLARRHLRRLWHPGPGAAGEIPTRASHGLDGEAFDRALPREFWREVVDRVAEEAPDTLLLAEAFWLMEGYFVRTLGMHRVYNSAFMHMLRDQDNAKFRQGLKNVLSHDARVLQRFVNFMNNPDEETAVAQFGTGDKYFATATLLATLPGLPLIGHGQLEGLEEKYGMEYARAYKDEDVDQGFLDHHDRMISPLLHRRAVFAGCDDFRLFDVLGEDGQAVDDLVAYANAHDGDRALVVVNNAHEGRTGRLHLSWAAGGAAGTPVADALGLDASKGGEVVLRDPRTGDVSRLPMDELRDRGLWIDLPAYGARAYLEITHEART